MSTRRTWRAGRARKSTILQCSNSRRAHNWSFAAAWPPAALAASVLHALRELNPNQPAAEFRPIRTIVDRAVSPRRFFMLLGGCICRTGPGTGHARHLRRNFLFGYAANAGDRDSHSARRQYRPGAAPGTHRHAAPGACRHDAGHIGGARSGQGNCFAVVCHLALGFADFSGNGAGAVAGCDASPATFLPGGPLASTPWTLCAAIDVQTQDCASGSRRQVTGQFLKTVDHEGHEGTRRYTKVHEG